MGRCMRRIMSAAVANHGGRRRVYGARPFGRDAWRGAMTKMAMSAMAAGLAVRYQGGNVM